MSTSICDTFAGDQGRCKLCGREFEVNDEDEYDVFYFHVINCQQKLVD